jgi:hypothetical protein
MRRTNPHDSYPDAARALTALERSRAIRWIASAAKLNGLDATECRALLDALDLDPRDGKRPAQAGAA